MGWDLETCMKILLKDNCDPNIFEIYGRYTLLTYCIINQKPKSLEMLLKYGADPNFNKRNHDRTTPLGIAVKAWIDKIDIKDHNHDVVDYFKKVSYLLVDNDAKLDIH